MTQIILAAPLLPTAPVPVATPQGAHLAGALLATRTAWSRGNGRIAGTVKEQSTPADLPLRRRVRLFTQADGRLFGETWSDAATGAYGFDAIDATQTYFVVAHDHTGNYNAVIKDGITPEVVP